MTAIEQPPETQNALSLRKTNSPVRASINNSQVIERTRRIFREFLSLDLPDNPKIKDLSAYSTKLKGRANILNTPVGLPTELAEPLLDRLDDGLVAGGFKDTIARIRTETSYMHDLEDVGIAAALSAGDLKKGKYGANTMFLGKEGLGKVLDNFGIPALYNGPFDAALLALEPPASRDMWKSLITLGVLPVEVAYQNYVLTQDRQWSSTQRALHWIPTVAYWIGYGVAVSDGRLHDGTMYAMRFGYLLQSVVSALQNDSLLGQVHALEAQASSPSFSNPNLDERSEIAKYVAIKKTKEGKRTEHAALLKKATRAFDLVRTLRVLGLDDVAIGALVSRAKYDETIKSFPKLDQQVVLERKKWGIEDAITFKAVLKALYARQQVEIRVQRHLARSIAAEELLSRSVIHTQTTEN